MLAAGTLSDAIGGLLPSAFAVALSPIPIVAVVVVLGSRRACTAGPAFALGWTAGLLCVSVVVVLLVGSGSDTDSDDPGLNWLKIAIGVLFLLMAAKQWTKRPKGGEEPETPGWMATIDSAAPPPGGRARCRALGGQPEEPGAHPHRRRVNRRGGARPSRHDDRRRRVRHSGLSHGCGLGALLPRRRRSGRARSPRSSSSCPTTTR